jgi:HEAT repeat protein
MRGGQDRMTKPELHRRTTRSRKKNHIPLSKLRAAEVVRTVVDHPRRLDELINLLGDKERSLRSRAAATLTRLSESHPGRLIRHIEALREGLRDDSAYVRWHLLYTLGRIISRFPRRASCSLSDLKARLGDEDKVVRRFACRGMEMVAASHPQLVHALFSADKEEIPPSIGRMLHKTSPKTGKQRNR